MSIVQFYNSLGIEGLSSILDDDSNNAYFDYIVKNILPGKTLDLGCGYGRIAKPLIESGYDVVGVDIMKPFITYANEQTKSNRFSVGDMLNLDSADESFNNVICLWSTFNHFLTERNQVTVLNEIVRILKTNGKAIIDVPTPEIYQTPSFQKIVTSSPDQKHICDYEVNGIPNSDFVHDELTLDELMKNRDDVSFYSVERILIGKLPRLILTFVKK